jgi:hypothetical protein
MLLHQSDKSLGRTHFVNGITSHSKLAAHEMIGKLILYLLTFCSGYSSQYFETAVDQRNVKKPVSKGGQKQTMGSDRVGDYVFALEEELLSISLLTSTNTLEFVNLYRDYIPSSMYRVKKALNRTVGMESNTLKYHLKVHRATNMEELGDLRQADTHVGEASLKYVSKRTSKASQKIASRLDVQSAQRNYENLVIDRAFQCKDVYADYIDRMSRRTTKDNLLCSYDDDDNDDCEMITNNVNDQSGTNDGMRGNRFYLHLERETRDRTGVRQQQYAFRFTGKSVRDRKYDIATWHDTSLRDEVSQFFSQHIMPNIDSTQDVQFFNQCRIHGVLYRSDPSDSNHVGRGYGWHDWGLVHLDGNAFKYAKKDNAMHFMGFFRITDKDMKQLDTDMVQIQGPGDYAIGHILANGRLPHSTSCEPVPPLTSEDVNESLDYKLWERAKRDMEEYARENPGCKRSKLARSRMTYKPSVVKEVDRAKYENYCRGHAQSRLVMKAQKLCHSEAKGQIHRPRLCVIPVQSIIGPTIAVPNLQHVLPPGTPVTKAKKENLVLGEAVDASFLFIRGRDTWARAMRKWVRKPT